MPHRPPARACAFASPLTRSVRPARSAQNNPIATPAARLAPPLHSSARGSGLRFRFSEIERNCGKVASQRVAWIAGGNPRITAQPVNTRLSIRN